MQTTLRTDLPVDSASGRPGPGRVAAFVSAVLAGGIFVLGLSVIVAQPASASIIPPAPVTFAGGLAEVGAADAAVASGCVVSGPAIPACEVAGLAVTTAVVGGLVLYQTHDTWLPWVQDLWKWGTTTDPVDTGQDGPNGGGTLPGEANTLRDIMLGTPSMSSDPWYFAVRIGINTTDNGEIPGVFLGAYECNDGWKGNGRDDNGLQMETIDGSGNGAVGNWLAVTNAGCEGTHGGVKWLHYWASSRWHGRSEIRSVGDDPALAPAPGATVPAWGEAQNTQTTSVDCVNALTGAKSTISNTEVGHVERFVVPSCESRLGDAWHPTKVRVSVGPDADHQSTVGTVTAGHDFSNTSDPWHDCVSGSGALTCRVAVWVNGQKCLAGQGGVCANWQDIAQDNPEDVQCRYGSHVVALGNCSPLRRAYEVGAGTTTVTGTNPDGSVRTEPATSPTDPGTEVIPRTGTNPTVPRTVPTPGITDADSPSCYGAAWGWNPVDWVVVPVKCALIWAFVPKTDVSASIGSIVDGLKIRAPFSWVINLAGIPAGVPGGSCPDWTINVGDFHKNVVCNSSFTGAILNARPILLGFMLSLAFWPLIRSIAYGSIPIIAAKAGER